MSFFRYPGGKKKLRQIITDNITSFQNYYNLEYREPFFGGGSIGLNLLQKEKRLKTIWINDKDLGISCLWTSVIKYEKELKQLVKDFIPSVDKFDEFKSCLLKINKIPLTKEEIVDCGFKKLAIHQISYSGLGTKSGGPLGGRKSGNVAGLGSTNLVKYPIDCRWSSGYIQNKIQKIHERFSLLSFRNGGCTSLDFSDVISDKEKDCILYLDPPYYIKGNDLYQFGFDEKDHSRLSCLLKNSKHYWVLSYDDCPEIRKLYDWAYIENIECTYSITAKRNKITGERTSREKKELIILSDKIKKKGTIFDED